MSDREAGRYRISLFCGGVPVDAEAQAAIDITEEFTHHPWHENAECGWDGASLLLSAENDFDAEGLALMDEFSDAIAACIADLMASTGISEFGRSPSSEILFPSKWVELQNWDER
jgi:hypothetical protein